MTTKEEMRMHMKKNYKYIKHKTKKCSICKEALDVMVSTETKEILWDQGNNADPYNSGRCCELCNMEVVLPLRITLWRLNC